MIHEAEENNQQIVSVQQEAGRLRTLKFYY